MTTDYGGGVAGLGLPADNGIQDNYRNLVEYIQYIGEELATQQKQNFLLGTRCEAMVEEAMSIQRSYFDVMKEVRELRNAIRSADAKLAYVSRRVQEFAPVEDLVILSDGVSYNRSKISEPAGKPGETDYLSNRTLILMLEKLRSLFPPGERSTPYSNLDDVFNIPPGPLVGMSRRGDPAGQLGVYPYPSGSIGPVPGMMSGAGAAGVYMNDYHPRHDAARGHAGMEMRFHPCIRVYGTCNYGKSCAYARYPFDACLSNLKGRCRFGSQCHERHVEYTGPLEDDGGAVEGAGGGIIN